MGRYNITGLHRGWHFAFRVLCNRRECSVIIGQNSLYAPNQLVKRVKNRYYTSSVCVLKTLKAPNVFKISGYMCFYCSKRITTL